MELAEQAKLVVTLGLQDKTKGAVKSIRGGLQGLNKDSGLLRKSLTNTGNSMKTGLKLGAGAALGGLALLFHTVGQGVDSLSELEDVQNATSAVLKSTGERANVGAKQVRELANEFEDLTTIDDKVIQGAENVLLGLKGIDDMNFKPVLAAALDLGVALKKGPEESARLVGRAMQDPIKGMSQLTRAGVKFTDAEKKKITQLVKTGHAFDAQDIILGKLTKQFGGRAAAAAEGYTGDQARLADAFEESRMALATGLMPMLSRVSRKLANTLKDPSTMKRIEDFGTTLAGVFSEENIGKGVDVVKGFWNFLSTEVDWASIKGGLQTTFDVSKKAFDLFNTMDPEMKKVLIGALAVNKITGGAVTSVIGSLAGIALKSLTSIIATTVTVVGKNVIGGGGGGVPGVPPVVPTGGAGAGGASWVSKLALIVSRAALPVAVATSVSGDTPTFDLSDTSEAAIGGRMTGVTRAIEYYGGKTDATSVAMLDTLRQEKAALEAGDVALYNKLAGLDGSVGGGAVLTTAAIAATNALIAGANATTVPAIGVLPDQISQLQHSFNSDTNALQAAVDNSNVSQNAQVAAVGTLLGGALGLVQTGIATVGGIFQRKDTSPNVTVNVQTNVTVRDVARTISTRNRLGTVPV